MFLPNVHTCSLYGAIKSEVRTQVIIRLVCNPGKPVRTTCRLKAAVLTQDQALYRAENITSPVDGYICCNIYSIQP